MKSRGGKEKEYELQRTLEKMKQSDVVLREEVEGVELRKCGSGNVIKSGRK